jgi:hypothetical protein
MRVEDHQGGAQSARGPAANPPPVHQPEHHAASGAAFHTPPQHTPAQHTPEPHIPEPPPAAVKNKPHHGGLGSGLGNLPGGFGNGLNSFLGGGSHGGGGHGGGLLSGGLLSGLGGGLKGLTGMFDHLPFGLDLGDILLFLMLLFLFVESGDDEYIIILAVIAFSLFKER